MVSEDSKVRIDHEDQVAIVLVIIPDTLEDLADKLMDAMPTAINPQVRETRASEIYCAQTCGPLFLWL